MCGSTWKNLIVSLLATCITFGVIYFFLFNKAYTKEDGPEHFPELFSYSQDTPELYKLLRSKNIFPLELAQNSKVTLQNLLNNRTTLSTYYSYYVESFSNLNSKQARAAYGSRSRDERLDIFKNNLQNIISHNQNPRRLWSMGVNEFTDYTGPELDALHKELDVGDLKTIPKLKRTSKWPSPPSLTGVQEGSYTYNDYVNWVTQGRVLNPRVQGGACNSGYAFAAASVLESAFAKKTGEFGKKPELIRLSVQQLIDCTEGGSYDNRGCKYGSLPPTFKYMNDETMRSDYSYPYEALEGGDARGCRYPWWWRGSVAYASAWGQVGCEGDELKMQKAILEEGPAATLIYVPRDLNWYHDGVYESAECGGKPPNHAVVIVGYGTRSERGKPDDEAERVDYWIVKNSRGKDWGGLGGYFRVRRNSLNMCGIASIGLQAQAQASWHK